MDYYKKCMMGGILSSGITYTVALDSFVGPLTALALLALGALLIAFFFTFKVLGGLCFLFDCF